MKRILSAALALVLLVSLTGCIGIHWRGGGWGGWGSNDRVRGDGDRVTKDFELDDFEKISIGLLDTRLYLTQGPVYSVSVEMDENLFNYIGVDVRGSTLEIDTGRYWLVPQLSADVYVTLPTLTELDIAGAVEFVSEGMITGDELDIDLSGASSGMLNLDYDEISLEVSGAGSAEVAGRADEFKADIAGAADIKARDLITQNANVSIAGAGSISVHCTGDLDVSIAGIGNCEYFGNPKTVNRSVAGLGSVESGD